MNYYRDKKGRIKPIMYPLMILGGIAFVLFFGWIVMLLWNAILPDLVNVRQMNIWQAMGLLVLCKILFGSWSGKNRRWGSHKERTEWRQNWSNMTPEERTKFRQEWRQRCVPGEEKYRGPDESASSGNTGTAE